MIGLWHDLGSIVTPVLLLPVTFALLGRARLGGRATVFAMLAISNANPGWNGKLVFTFGAVTAPSRREPRQPRWRARW